MNTPNLLRAALWAGVIALDATGFGPLMVSQPLVCGPIFGWLMGQLTAGVVIGGIAQLLWMDVTPVGVGIPYDATAVTLLGVYWSSLNPQPGASDYVLAMVLAVPMGYVFQALDKQGRKLNTLAARKLESVSDDHLMAALSIGIGLGLVWTWLRAAIAYGLVMFAGAKVLAWVAKSPVMPWVQDHALAAIVLLPMAGMGVVLELFLSEEPERRFQALKNRAKRF